MRVLIGCEESQEVTKAFREKGHEAYSCDLQECSGGHPEWHLQENIFKVIRGGQWDMMVCFPPCTYLTNAGAKHFSISVYGNKALDRWEKRIEAARFFNALWNVNIPKICIENPVGFMNSEGGLPATQIIQPYYFGDSFSKRTCLWLKNLPSLVHAKENNLFLNQTHVGKGVIGKNGGEWMNTTEILNLPKEERSKARSKTFPGIAKAMANQWG